MPKVYRKGTTDEKVIREILQKNAYRKKKIGFDVGPNDVWLDGGAQIGIFAEYAAAKKAKKVFCFEPEKDNFELLKTNCNHLSENSSTEFVLQNKAIQNKAGKAFLNIAPNTWRHAIDTHYKKELPKQEIECVSFSEVISSNPEINSVKLDIEGSELEILHSRQDFGNVRKLVFEYSFTKKRSMIYFFECVSMLESAGFKVFYPPSYKRQRHNGVPNLWGGFIDDVVFCLRF
jgi:FkbM family methyltransferase